MKEQILSPGVQDRRDAHLCSEPLWIGCQRQERGRCRPEQQIVEQPLVVQYQRRQQGRQGEHDMKVADREQTLQAGFEPGGAFARLAFGAMAIPTGVVGDPCETTVGAGIDMAAQRRSAALGQAPQDADLLMRDRMPSLIGRAVGAQDVPDFQGCRRHGSALRFLLGRCGRRQQIEGADNLMDALDADMRVQTGGPDGVMPQQGLQHDQIHAGIEQMRGKAMPQRLSTMLIHPRR